MHHRTLIPVTVLLVLILLTCSLAQATRIKDMADIEGVRENQLIGYGLVIGLNGTGDDIKKSVFTKQAIVNMTKRMGMGLTPKMSSSRCALKMRPRLWSLRNCRPLPAQDRPSTLWFPPSATPPVSPAAP
jgi:hypothetical protein